jgi:hypothetical protein
MDTLTTTRSTRSLQDIQETLSPGVMRRRAIAELDELFRSGSAPDPAPDGFLPGRLVTMSLTRPSDAFVRSFTGMYMPWLGKSFDREAGTGLNVLVKSAKAPMKTLWPSYKPISESDDRIEAFPFNTRIGPGAVDPDVQVLKIDYDFEANPGLLIRKILDELVQIDNGLYLGKILYRRGKSFKPIGFFSLESR